MDVLILHTVGRRSSQPRQSPLAWFADGQDAWQIVASGGRRHPDWYLNLMAHPDRVSIELPGGDAVPATPHRVDGADRAPAWQRITVAQPRYAKYLRKSDREYPVVRSPWMTASARGCRSQVPLSSESAQSARQARECLVWSRACGWESGTTTPGG